MTHRNDKAWSVAFEPAVGSAAAGPPHNILVVSDLHIGEALGPADPGYLKQIAALNHAFSRFLEYYSTDRTSDRPWRLVIAGDMIDFLHASFTAASDRFPGPNSAERAAVDTLERVVSFHRRVFRDLAGFIAAGNELVVIKGNHDAEFHWDDVQTRFTQLLSELFVEASSAACPRSADEVAAFERRISFCNWFYYEHGLVYIEHGNQYDEWCSFENVLSPVISERPEQPDLEVPISHLTYRAFAGVLPHLDVHGIDTWKLLDFVRWLVGLGPRVLARLAYTYFASLRWMVSTRNKLAAAGKKTREEHLRRLKQLTQRFRIGEDILEKLDDLRHRPAGKSVLLGLRMLYMDHIFVGLLNVLVLGALLVSPGDGILRASVGGGFGLLSGVLLIVLSRLREVESHPKLLRMARKVGQLMKVPFVVFGHTHVPVVERIGEEESWYINTGSWTAGERRGLTHVCILLGADGPSAELRRWDVGEGRPLAFETVTRRGR